MQVKVIDSVKKMDDGDKLHEIMVIWNTGILDIKNGYLKCGEAIHIIKRDRLWKLYGAHIMSFSHFCNKELCISISQANRLDQIYREVGYLLKNIPIDISKVTLLLPYLAGKVDEEKIDLLESSKNLTVEDIKNNLKDLDGESGKATDVCLHTENEIWNKCTNCHKFWR
jgi:hypothetical protein